MASERMSAGEERRTARSLEKSLESTCRGLRLFLDTLERSGMREAQHAYRELQLVLLQQRLWARTYRRAELDPLWRKLAETAGALHEIFAGFAAILEPLRYLESVGEVCSFHGLKEDVWASKLADGTPFQEAFRKWMERVVRPGVHCAYLNGHHWRAGSPACRGRSPRPSGRSGRTENHWMECAAARGLQARFPYRGRKAGYVLSRSMKW